MKIDLDEIDWKLLEVKDQLDEMKTEIRANQERVEAILKGEDPDQTSKDRILEKITQLEKGSRGMEHQLEKMNAYQSALNEMIREVKEKVESMS